MSNITQCIDLNNISLGNKLTNAKPMHRDTEFNLSNIDFTKVELFFVQFIRFLNQQQSYWYSVSDSNEYSLQGKLGINDQI